MGQRAQHARYGTLRAREESVVATSGGGRPENCSRRPSLPRIGIRCTEGSGARPARHYGLLYRKGGKISRGNANLSRCAASAERFANRGTAEVPLICDEGLARAPPRAAAEATGRQKYRLEIGESSPNGPAAKLKSSVWSHERTGVTRGVQGALPVLYTSTKDVRSTAARRLVAKLRAGK